MRGNPHRSGVFLPPDPRLPDSRGAGRFPLAGGGVVEPGGLGFMVLASSAPLLRLGAQSRPRPPPIHTLRLRPRQSRRQASPQLRAR
ncbi:hypothetical protein NDU88_001306 [Pleurodeles waltl]|uniref:Uncharacterized protein n=1 Tax=Pleurodeles waltl TaxID=8319 RepID=A0AAV7MMB1_PLEWA|nr:hypothetical protein NDU88_001306 [Pleurodeles waltl]